MRALLFAPWLVSCSLFSNLSDLTASSTGSDGAAQPFDAARDGGPEDAGTDVARCDAPCIELLASGQEDPGQVIAGDGRVIWINRATRAIRVASPPPNPTIVALDDAGAVGQIAHNGTVLVWNGTQKVSRLIFSGMVRGEVVNYAADHGGMHITLGPADAYWHSNVDSQALYLNATGPTATTARTISMIGSTRAWGGFTTSKITGTPYIACHAGASKLLATLAGNVATTMTTTTELAISLAASAGELFWTEANGRVAKIPLSARGVDPAPQIELAKGNVAGYLTIDNTYVYWTDPGAGNVLYCPQSACPPQGPLTLVAAGIGVYGIAVDDVYVYFTNPSRGTVEAVPKPP